MSSGSTVSFDPRRYLPTTWLAEITNRRVRDPGAVRRAAASRQRRSVLVPSGSLVILAADHPPRHVNRVGNEPLRMGDRQEYLARIVRVLEHPSVDGIMATPDIIDDLFLLNALLTDAGGPDLLSGRVLIGSMNRGGLAGATWELDDPFTAYSVESLVEFGLDGGKQLFRLSLGERDCLRTMEACAQAVTQLARRGMPSFLEPLPVARAGDGSWAVTKTAEALIPVVGVSQSLGESSAHTWLKLPAVPDFGRVAAATTLPILLLGGESRGDLWPVLEEMADCLAAGSNVRGLLMGRNILFPGDLDPYTAADAACTLVSTGKRQDAAARLSAPAPSLDALFGSREAS